MISSNIKKNNNRFRDLKILHIPEVSETSTVTCDFCDEKQSESV